MAFEQNLVKMSADGVLSLPPELINIIASYLSTEDVANLRLTSKYIYTSSVRAFASAAFGILKTDLSYNSLQRLGDIAYDRRYAPYVTGIVVCAKTNPAAQDNEIGTGVCWAREMNGLLKMKQVPIKDLRKWFGNFINCTSFRFRRHTIPRGQEERVPEWLSIGDAINIFLFIIAKLKRKVQCFDIRNVWSRRVLHGADRDVVDLSGLTRSPTRLSGFKDAFKDLTELSLRLEPCDKKTIGVILRLIKKVPGLRELAVNFGESNGGCSLLTSVLSTRFAFRLKKLELYKMAGISAFDLVSFLAQQKDTLTHLSLVGMHLNEDMGWLTVMRYIRANCLNLQTFVLSDLRDGPKESIFSLRFPGLRTGFVVPGHDYIPIIRVMEDDDEGGFEVSGISYRGPNTRTAFWELTDMGDYVID